MFDIGYDDLSDAFSKVFLDDGSDDLLHLW